MPLNNALLDVPTMKTFSLLASLTFSLFFFYIVYDGVMVSLESLCIVIIKNQVK